MAAEPSNLRSQTSFQPDGGLPSFQGWGLRLADVALPLAIVAAIVVLIVPLPTFILDLLIAANLTLAVLVVLTTMSVTNPLQFSAFPTILLTTALFRLVLNFASTRLILAKGGEKGLDAAGGVIRAFGEFVAGGQDQIVVGVILFLILFVIQFVVITKGSTRISEVAARFMLDGLPGRQMAIDADLASGLIDQHEAQRRRAEVSRQADFFAAMDGAGKFVRGDAVAGLFISAINIVAGLVLGVAVHGMGLLEAAEVFTKLTIGDGLVSQLPAFLIALATGLIVTRSTSESHLGREVGRQLLARPEVLGAAAGLLAILMVTPLPALPLGTLALGLAGAAYSLAQRHRGQPDAAQSNLTSFNLGETSSSHKPAANLAAGSGAASISTPSPMPSLATRLVGPDSVAATTHEGAGAPLESGGVDRVEEGLAVDPLELAIGYRLIPLADATKGSELLEGVRRLRVVFARELGLILPQVRIRDDLSLPPFEYRFKLRDVTIGGGVAYPGRLLAVQVRERRASRGETGNRERPNAASPGRDAIDPISGHPAVWIHAEGREVAELAGCRVRDAAAVVVGHFREALLRHADQLLTRGQMERLLDRVRAVSPQLVLEVSPGLLRPGELQRVLQGLVRERVSIRDLETILERLAEHASRTTDVAELIERVRVGLGRSLVQPYIGTDGKLRAIIAPRALELRALELGQGPWWNGGSLSGGLEAEEKRRRTESIRAILKAIRLAAEPRWDEGLWPVLICSIEARPLLKELTRMELPQLPVISWAELPHDLELQTIPLPEIASTGRARGESSGAA